MNSQFNIKGLDENKIKDQKMRDKIKKEASAANEVMRTLREFETEADEYIKKGMDEEYQGPKYFF